MIDEKELENLYKTECFLKETMGDSWNFVFSSFLAKCAESNFMTPEKAIAIYDDWKSKHKEQGRCKNNS